MNSDLAGCVRTHLRAGGCSTEELLEMARDFDISIEGIDIRDQGLGDEDGPPPESGIGYWSATSASELLPSDPSSPHLLLLAGREAISQRQPGVAEKHLLGALVRLPEYSEAWALLAQVYRQQQDLRRTADALMRAITSPLCFGARDRKKLLMSLQRMPDEAYRDGADPCWGQRHRLSRDRGVKENADHQVFEELIANYHSAGMGARAVGLRILTGELMGCETVSSRERNGWTAARYGMQLKQDLERAGVGRGV